MLSDPPGLVAFLSHVVSFFAPCRFVSCVQLFLQCDSVCPQSVTQQVTHRVAPLLVGGTYGDNVRLLNSVIQVPLRELSSTTLLSAWRPSWF